MRACFLAPISFVIAGIAGIVSAQAQLTDPCASPSQQLAVMTISELTPNGTMEGFNKAVADHAKWYVDNGYRNKVFVAPLLVSQSLGGNIGDYPGDAVVKSQRYVVTFNLNHLNADQYRHDAGWDNYVAEYRANSTVKQTLLMCFPNADVPPGSR